MKIEGGIDKDSEFYIVHDLDNDCILEGGIGILWADDEKGQYECIKCVIESGEIKVVSDAIKEIKSANIKLIDVRLPENYDLIKRISPQTIDLISSNFYQV